MGVMLALSAVFAVVISTISMPGDRATAQMTDPDEVRAKAWWASLKDADSNTQALRANVLLGKASDGVADVDGQEDTQGRQLGDPTRTNTDTTTTPPGTALTEIEIAQLDYDHASQTTANKDAIKAFVDAAQTPPVVSDSVDSSTHPAATDIYAVGDALAGGSSTALRGFQSVELWWNHLTCTEARTAVGEDNDAASTTDQDTDTIFDPEESTVCKATLNADSSELVSWDLIPYDDLGDAQDMANAVGQAILGLDDAGSPMTADNARAKAWWDSLSATERVDALYGSAATDAVAADIAADANDATKITVTRAYLASREYGEIKRTTKFVAGELEPSTDAAALSLNDASMELVDTTKALINDRWAYVYHMGGMNDKNKDEVVYWWDSIDATQRRIAVGVDNVPEATASQAGYGLGWDALQDDPPVAEGKTRQANVFTHGQAILGHEKLPDVAAWWATLNADQMVYVVYGNPPMRAPYDHDDDTNTENVTTVTDPDKAVFRKPYDMLTGVVPATGHLPATTTALLTRHTTPNHDANNDGDTGDTFDHDGDSTTAEVNEADYYSAKAIVDTIAMELFDPPTMQALVTSPPNSGAFGTVAADGTFAATTVDFSAAAADDNDFDWPYNTDNKPASVADWWESTDCRVMRLAVGQDNQYLNAAVVGVDANTDGDFEDDGDTAPMNAETSIYCGHFVGSGSPARAEGAMGVLSKEAQKRVEEVGMALLGLSEPGRPSFNEPAEGDPLIMGTAQVGATLTVNTTGISDGDVTGDIDFSYQWLRDGDPISGATGSSYILTAEDSGKRISIRVTFTDDERYPEERTSPASLATSPIVSSPGVISKIEPGIRGVTVSAGEKVVLSVKAYGLQGVQDQKLSAGEGLEWNAKDGGTVETEEGDGDWQVIHTARSSPGTYTVVASFVNDGDCVAKLEERDTACTADFVVRVRRAAPPQPVEEAPVNPPGEIPSLLSDDGGNQYEVFTPVEGGTFDSGEGYSITAPSGAVPNGEFIGVRMSDDGPASNVGMTHQRYTLGGNMYGVHAVDSSEATVSSYVLDDPANVCVPLPDELRTNISDLALVVINSDGSLTILAANVHIGAAGTSVCGNLSNLPASVAVGSQGAPAAIPTATPEPEPVLPDTGATAPSSNSALWALILGIAIVSLGTLTALSRRRNRSVSR